MDLAAVSFNSFGRQEESRPNIAAIMGRREPPYRALRKTQILNQSYVKMDAISNLHRFLSKRLGGDDSDGSEMEYRDSNSETSTNDSELERVSDHASWSSLHAGERIHEGESLLFEYFESAAPSLRIPLSDKDLYGSNKDYASLLGGQEAKDEEEEGDQDCHEYFKRKEKLKEVEQQKLRQANKNGRCQAISTL